MFISPLKPVLTCGDVLVLGGADSPLECAWRSRG